LKILTLLYKVSILLGLFKKVFTKNLGNGRGVIVQETWAKLDGFSIYEISTFGRVINVHRDMLLTPVPNQEGISKVSLVRDGRTTSRSLAVLVAQTFLPKERVIFNSPINLNGDRMDCHVDNLMWRPRWFAVHYHQQFEREEFHGSRQPIEDLTFEEKFIGWKDPSIRYGLRYIDIIMSCTNHTPTIITSQRFRYLD
jgi:hypothetical protein